MILEHTVMFSYNLYKHAGVYKAFHVEREIPSLPTFIFPGILKHSAHRYFLRKYETVI